MTISFPVFDGQGVLTLRKFPDVAHLPAIHDPGELCCVDDGTTTTVYQALRVAGTLGWYIVASPVLPGTKIRVAPSDARYFEYSNDSGATWNSLSYKVPYSVNTAPASGAENQITGSTFAPALTVIGAGMYSGLDAASPAAPAITARQGGATNAPGLQVIRPDDSFYPSLIESVVDGVNRPVVGRHGGIVTLPVGTSLPTADATWLNAIVSLSPSGGAGGAIYTCVQNADLSYSWKSLIFSPPVTPTGVLGLYPAIPARGAGAVTFVFAVLAQGSPLPWLLPSGYKISVDIFPSYFGYDDGTNTYFNTLVGSDLYNVSGFGVNRLIFSKFAIDAGGKETSALGVVDGLIPLTADQDMVVVLGANVPALLSVPPVGIALVNLTITAPSGADWTITPLSGGVGPPTSGFFGDTIAFDASGIDSGFYGVEVHISPHVKLTIVDVANYTNGNDPGNTMLAYNTDIPASNDPHTWTAWFAPSTSQAINPVGVIFDNIQAFQLSSRGTRATGHLKIEAP